MADPIRIVALCGSLNPDSRTMHALRIAARGAADAGADVEIVDLRDHDLPVLFSPHAPSGSGESVDALRRKLGAADAMLVGSPEYHGSFSGALKNALDLMGFAEFEGKMVALVGVAGGALGATNALNHLRVVFRQLHAWVVPDQVSVAGSSAAFDDDGAPTESAVETRLTDLGLKLVKFATLHREGSANPFVQLWEQCVKNPGG